MNIVYYGNNNRGKRILEVLCGTKHTILHAFGQDAEEGWYDSIEDTAKKNFIPYQNLNYPNQEEHWSLVEKLKPDLGIMCGFSKYMGKRIRSIPKHGIINLHASKLPNYRGAAPLNWAIINGESEVGLSIYFIDKGIDTGPIVAQETIDIDENTTIADLLPITLDLYSKMIVEVCALIDQGNFKAVVQDLNKGSYYTKRRPKDGLIIWGKQTDKEIHNLVRALTKPYPCAYIETDNTKINVVRTEIEAKNYHGIPGRIATRKKDGIVVIAKNRGIKIKVIEVDGVGEMKASEYFKKVGIDL